MERPGRHCAPSAKRFLSLRIEEVMGSCSHTGEIRVVEASGRVCEACVREGTRSVALHLCTTCGHVGCCVSSPGAHAKKHYLETGHPVIRSTERGWFWCYPDKRYVQPKGSGEPRRGGLLVRLLGRDR